MTALADAMTPWHEFYMLLGTASATMVGLLFVAASVGSGVFTTDRPAALRVFLSASVVHFSSILTASLVVLAPLRSEMLFAVLILGCGLFGLAYSCLALRDTMRDGLSVRIAWDDRLWYMTLPIIAYLFETASGALLAVRLDLGCVALALAVGILLVIGIHNAWDITVWSITRPRD